METIEVELPELGDGTVLEARVALWFFEEGDEVEKDDVLVEVVAEDETYDVRCPYTGRLEEIVVPEDEVLEVGDVLALIDVPEE